MSRKYCTNCSRPISVCFCHCLKNIDNLWPIWIIQDSSEKKHAIGTVQIAKLSLHKIDIFNLEDINLRSQIRSNNQSQIPLLVYPGGNSLDLKKLCLKEPRPLLLLDGSWRKTRKMFYDMPELDLLPRININPEFTSRYRIRKSPNNCAISTLEAIYFILSTLESNTVKYESLLHTMDWMIDKQIECMGADIFLKNYKKMG